MSDLVEFERRTAEADAGFAVPATRPAPAQATMVEQARAIAEVRAAVMVAMDRPRDRTAAIAEMREVCGIQGLADRAFFRVQRGAEHVNGESIHLARELARCWGNISYGVKELSRDDIRGQSELLAYAWDMQTNARSEITFMVPHRRDTRKGPRSLTGTQEIYENNASFAGRRLREAIFAVLPVWFKAEAADICHRTLNGEGSGKPLIQRIADLRQAFADIGVTAEQLETKRGRRVDDFLPEDLAALRIVYGSLKRGEVTIAEEFPSEQPALPPGGKLDALERAVTPTETASPTAGERPGEDRATETHAGPSPRQGEPSPGASAEPDRSNPVPSQATPAANEGTGARGRTAGAIPATGATPPRSAIWAEASYALPAHTMPGNPDAPDWDRRRDDLVFLIGEASAAEIAKLRADNKASLDRMRRDAGDHYREVMVAVSRREAELGSA